MEGTRCDEGGSLQDLAEREKLTISTMIGIYCRWSRHSSHAPCAECAGLIRYAHGRFDACPYHHSNKPVCGLCPTNCFSLEMHRVFREVMRQSGPGMLLRHPLLTIAHIWDAVRYKMTASRSIGSA